MSDLFGNPEDRFSRVEAQIILLLSVVDAEITNELPGDCQTIE